MQLKPTYNMMAQCPLEYYDQRSRDIDMLIIHSTPSYDAADLIYKFQKHQVCAHYIIDHDGAIIQCVAEQYRAWHAGESYWQKEGGSSSTQENLNANSIGIEICSPTLGQKPFSEKQINSLKWLAADISWRNHIHPYKIVGHSDVAAKRKPDPGKALPWDELSDVGVGYWFNLEDARKMPEISTRKALGIIGYDVRTEEAAAAAAYAFLRRFIPHRVEVPKKMLDIISNVYPKDQIIQQELLNNKITNVIARAVARKVINTRIQEKRMLEQQLFKQRINTPTLGMKR